MPKHDALLLIGHGSGRYPQAGDPLRRHAAALRQAGHLATVAFLNGSPSVPEALRALGGASIRIVPFFMEDGYFTRVVIPQALGGRAVRLCPPVGLHPALPALIEAQAVAACESLTIRPDAASVLLIGHGSASAPGRHLALHDHAASLAKGGRFAQVEAACLEEPPFTADTLARLSGRPVIAIGYFANLGGHVQDDVQALVAAERSARGSEGRLVHFAGNVTDAPAMIGVILDQAGFSGAEGK